MTEPKFLQKITDSVGLSLLIWVLLLLLKSYVFTNDLFGLIAELGGLYLFLSSLYKWSKRKSKKGNS